MRILPVTTILAMLFVVGCGKKEDDRNNIRYLAAYPQAVISAVYKNESSKITLAGTYSHGKDGKPKRYGGGAGFANGTVKFYYHFMGATLVPVDGSGTTLSDGDVYVFRVKTSPEASWELIPFIFKGGTATVYDKNGLVIRIDEK